MGLVGLILLGLSQVVLIRGMQQVEACGHSPGFGYKGKTCDPQSVLAIGVRPMSLWPLVTESNIGVWSCLDVI
jgi:hypothetical protein